jgi:hypothetical protein
MNEKPVILLKGYDALVGGISQVLDAGRSRAAWTLNSIVSAAYWEVGRRIVEFEQAGQERAEYGERIVEQLAKDLTKRHGRGFGRSNLFQIRAFFLAYREKVQTPSGQLTSGYFEAVRQALPLPWSAYSRLLSVRNPAVRESRIGALSKNESRVRLENDAWLFGKISERPGNNVVQV